FRFPRPWRTFSGSSRKRSRESMAGKCTPGDKMSPNARTHLPRPRRRLDPWPGGPRRAHDVPHPGLHPGGEPDVPDGGGNALAGAIVATALSAAFATLLMAFLANYPIALAPGMGMNAFFAYSICAASGVRW